MATWTETFRCTCTATATRSVHGYGYGYGYYGYERSLRVAAGVLRRLLIASPFLDRATTTSRYDHGRLISSGSCVKGPVRMDHNPGDPV